MVHIVGGVRLGHRSFTAVVRRRWDSEAAMPAVKRLHGSSASHVESSRTIVGAFGAATVWL